MDIQFTACTFKEGAPFRDSRTQVGFRFNLGKNGEGSI